MKNNQQNADNEVGRNQQNREVSDRINQIENVQVHQIAHPEINAHPDPIVQRSNQNVNLQEREPQVEVNFIRFLERLNQAHDNFVYNNPESSELPEIQFVIHNRNGVFLPIYINNVEREQASNALRATKAIRDGTLLDRLEQARLDVIISKSNNT